MRRSKSISLTLVASVSLVAAGCSDEINTTREIYANKEDCVKDWGSEDDCESDGHSYHGPHYYYHGGKPYYFRRGSHTAEPLSSTARFASVAPNTHSSFSKGSFASTSVSRGGFGRSASGHSSGS